MKKIVLIYGLITGIVTITSITLGLEYGQGSVWLGYLIMFIAFSTIFVAVRQYRNQHLGGIISFKIGLFVGLGITFVAAVAYSLFWELYLMITEYKFIDDYAQAIIDNSLDSGASEAASTLKGNEFRQQYCNPIHRIPLTMLEILPPGVVVSIVSAVALRNHGWIK